MQTISFPSLLLLLVLLTHCSSIQQLEQVSHTRERPTPVRFIPTVEKDNFVDKSDHRVRSKNKLEPTILLDFVLSSSSLTSKEKTYFQNEISSFIKKEKTKFIILPKDLADNERISFIQKNDIDAVLNLVDDSSEEAYIFSAKLVDSVNGKEYGVTSFEWKKPETKEASANNNGIEILQKNSELKILNRLPDISPKILSFPSSSDWQTLVKLSNEGTLQIFASSSDTKVLLDGKAIGEVPIKNFKFINGPHRLQISKPGKDPITKYFHLRAGEIKNFYQEWDDDISTASLRVFSFPQGLNVIFDGSIKGETDQYFSEIAPGEFNIQLTRQWEGGEIIFSETDIGLEPKNSKSLALPFQLEDGVGQASSEFWTPMGQIGFRPEYKPKLGFKRENSRLVPGDYGFYSSFIFPDYVEINGTFPNPDNASANQYGFFWEVGKDTFMIDTIGKEIAFYHFQNGVKKSQSLHVWEFKKDDPEKERPFEIETNREKGIAYITLGNKKIFEGLIDMNSLWRIGVITRGEKFYEGSPLRDLKIKYPDLIKLQKKWDK